MSDSTSSTDNLSILRRGSEAAAEMFARLARGAATVLVVAVPIVVTPWGSDGYNQVKALTTAVLVVLALTGWIGARLAPGKPAWKFTVSELPLWGVLLAVLLSSVTSVNPRLSYFGAPGRYEGLFAYCGYVALFLVGVHFFGSHARWRALTVAAGIAAVITSAYGLLQVFIPPLFAGEAFIRQWYSVPGIARIPSTLGSPVVFGGYLTFMIPLLLATGLAERGVARHRWRAAACLALIALALTLTRAAWLATFIGLVVFGILGALAYGAMWGSVVWSAVRMWRRATDAPRVLAAGWLAAITAYLVQVQFSFSVVALAPIVWLLAGSAAGWEAETRDS